MNGPLSTVAWFTAGALLLVGCRSDTSRWLELRESEQEELPGAVLFARAPVRVVASTQSNGRACTQVTIDGRSMLCADVEGLAWGGGGLRVRDHRVILGRSATDVRDFVVWSSASPAGRDIEPVNAADHSLLIWVMEPGEEPWGVQAIGPDGELVHAESFVGLPGD